MIHACSQSSDIDGAERYCRLMMVLGIEPELVTYNTLINTCASQGNTQRAEDWFKDMVNNKVVPNEVTYGTLCKVFARNGEAEKVKRILQCLDESGFSLNEYFFASWISACGAADPPDRAGAEEALMEVMKRGLRPHRVRRVLARVLGEQRVFQLMNQWNKHMECKSRSSTSPSTETVLGPNELPAQSSAQKPTEPQPVGTDFGHQEMPRHSLARARIEESPGIVSYDTVPDPLSLADLIRQNPGMVLGRIHV
jgi:pentatricopeptide repeat protein